MYVCMRKVVSACIYMPDSHITGGCIALLERKRIGWTLSSVKPSGLLRLCPPPIDTQTVSIILFLPAFLQYVRAGLPASGFCCNGWVAEQISGGFWGDEFKNGER